MCRKDYTDEMAKYLKSLAFRASFFSMPDFKGRYLALLASNFPSSPYKERKLSQFECQSINIDAVADDLDIPLVELLDQKVYVFDDVNVAGRMATVYVCHYYIYVYIPLNGSRLREESVNQAMSLMLSAEALGNNQVQRKSCIANHIVDTPADKFFDSEILDLEAFPQFYPKDIRAGRYSDSHQEADGSTVTLIRDVSRGIEDSDVNYLHITIESIVDTKHDNFGGMYSMSLTESARCFSNKNER